MKSLLIPCIIVVVLSSCQYLHSGKNNSISRYSETGSINVAPGIVMTNNDGLLLKKDSTIKAGFTGYRLIINNGRDFRIHKDELKSILANIKTENTGNTLYLNINSPEIRKEVESKLGSSENLAVYCSDDPDDNYIVGDNSLFRFSYPDNHNMANVIAVTINNILISFLPGCNGYNVFCWEIKGDSLKLKSVFPDIITYPPLLSYWTEIGTKDIVTPDSVNYFIAAETFVNWADPAEAEHVSCDQYGIMSVLYFNPGKGKLKVIHRIDKGQNERLDNITLQGSSLVVHYTHNSYRFFYKNEEVDVIEFPEGEYPDGNPVDVYQTQKTTQLSDTVSIQEYLF